MVDVTLPLSYQFYKRFLALLAYLTVCASSTGWWTYTCNTQLESASNSINCRRISKYKIWTDYRLSYLALPEPLTHGQPIGCRKILVGLTWGLRAVSLIYTCYSIVQKKDELCVWIYRIPYI